MGQAGKLHPRAARVTTLVGRLTVLFSCWLWLPIQLFFQLNALFFKLFNGYKGGQGVLPGQVVHCILAIKFALQVLLQLLA